MVEEVIKLANSDISVTIAEDNTVFIDSQGGELGEVHLSMYECIQVASILLGHLAKKVTRGDL